LNKAVKLLSILINTLENTEVVAQNGQSIEIGNACHTKQRIKTKQKQAKNEHNVRWTPLSASKHK
jgi:hypothetical protein